MTEHYFNAQPMAERKPRTVRISLPDHQFNVITDTGVFSSRGLDPGTEVLLTEQLPLPVDGDLLDLGCGYGPITLALALRYPDRMVWAVDVNERAVELTAQNAQRLGLANVRAVQPDQVPSEQRFAAIIANPPIRIGKTALHDLLVGWLSRLLPGGVAYLVVSRHLGADSLMTWLETQGYPTTRLASRKGFRIAKVSVQPTG